MIIQIMLQIVLWFFPWHLRRLLLQWIFGFRLSRTARIGKSIILAKEVVMGEGAIIRDWNFCKQIDRIELKPGACIAAMNLITGIHVTMGVGTVRCEFILGENSTITSRHFIDCSGGVSVGRFATLAGTATQVLTHSIDVYQNIQSARPISVGDYCFVGTRCLLLPGSKLPAYSVLGAGSVLTKAYLEGVCVYAGDPARLVKRLEKSEVAYFNRMTRFVE